MIDLDALEADLDRALTVELPVPPSSVVPVSAPAVVPPPPPRDHQPAKEQVERSSRPAPTPSSLLRPSPLAPAEAVWDDFDVEAHGRAIVELVSQAKMAEADLHIVAHAELAHDSPSTRHRGDAIGWAVMRALLESREDAVRDGLGELQALDPEGGDHEAQERFWAQRFALVLACGDADERYEVLDHCRERAWCHGEVAWQGRLTLLLAVLGRDGEAVREFDATIGAALGAPVRDAAWLDLATDLAEAAATLGDATRCDLARQCLARGGPAPVAIVGRAWVCKGPVARYVALAARRQAPADLAAPAARAS
ncbi:MAG: hypothetical protein M3011_10615 [Actinomycetota bacterium]|nr:hypothetical protein [Actinomycetota bacterium]